MRRIVPVFVTVAMLSAFAYAEVPASDPRVTPVVLAYRKARPAVVNISTEQIISQRVGAFGNDPFANIFPSPFVRDVPVLTLGSGVVIHPSGFVVTNAHVVRQAQKITVALDEQTKVPASVISADPKIDLAVLKVEVPPGKELPYLPLGRSDDLMVGESVIAIGNPLGYSNSLTTGVISAIDRALKFTGNIEISGLIQTDAPINPGNSGGPLLNIKGELIGINTAIRGDAQNIGFAIPADALAKELSDLLDYERLNRVVVGMSITPRHGAAGDELMVTAVRAGTPAEAGLRVGDRVLAMNGKVLKQMPDFACPMISVKAGDTVNFTCIREGKELAVALKVAAKPRPDGKALAERLFGLQLRELTPQLARDLRLPVDHGMLVTGVVAGSAAQKIGIQPKDVVFQLERLYLKDMDSLATMLEDLKGGEVLRIGIIRGNVAAWVQIPAQAVELPGSSAPASQPARGGSEKIRI